jgi:hypothetical protein
VGRFIVEASQRRLKPFGARADNPPETTNEEEHREEENGGDGPGVGDVAFPGAALADDGGAPYVSVDATCSDGDGVGASVDPGASPSVPPASANGQISDAITKSGE